MKQLLFLLLFPAYAMAQYPGNANQKITLGEQTTADGLVFRGVAADTTRKPSVDTMAYILLDTNTNIIWQYKKATSNAWLRLNLLPSDTTSMLTNYYRSGRALGTPLSGILTNATGLPISTGLTGLGAANRIPYASSTTALTTSSGLTFDGTNFATTGTATATRFNPTGTSATGTGMFLPAANTLGFSINGTERVQITSTGVLQLSGPSQKIYSNNGTTNYVYYQLDNTGGSLTIGIERSTGGGLANGTSGYSGLISTNNATALAFGTNVTERMRITSGGEVTINNLSGSGSRAVNAAADGTLSASSSITIKENVNDLNYGLDKIMELQPKSFNYIDKNKYGEGLDIGFIAEDVYPIIPEATGTMNDGFIYFDAVKLIPVLTKAIQEQQALIKALEQRIINLENK